MQNIYYIYHLIDPRTNEVFYVGRGKDRRAYKHMIPSLRIKKSSKNEMIDSILNEGLDVLISKVYENISFEESHRLEKSEIQRLGKENLTNKTTGGQGVEGFSSFLGRTHTPEAKEKIRQSKLGEKNHFYGKKHTPEWKKKVSEKNSGELHWNFGQKHANETRQKISNKLKGIPKTDEEKLARSETMREKWRLRKLGLIESPDHSNRKNNSKITSSLANPRKMAYI